MAKKPNKLIEEEFERYCDRCLSLAVKEYLHRARHSELRELETRIGFLLESPCKSEVCQEECNEHWGKS